MISAELALSDLSREAGLQRHAVKRFLCGVAFSEYLIGSHLFKFTRCSAEGEGAVPGFARRRTLGRWSGKHFKETVFCWQRMQT